MRGGRTMEQYTEAFVGIDTAKNKHALAIADPGRDGEIRYLGEIDSAPAAVERMIRKLAGRYEKLYFGYEAGPDGVWALPSGPCFGSRLHRGRALVGAKAARSSPRTATLICRSPVKGHFRIWPLPPAIHSGSRIRALPNTTTGGAIGAS